MNYDAVWGLRKSVCGDVDWCMGNEE